MTRASNPRVRRNQKLTTCQFCNLNSFRSQAHPQFGGLQLPLAAKDLEPFHLVQDVWDGGLQDDLEVKGWQSVVILS